ncbi:DNA ligase [Undibacterium amnicola]|uniref:DNA ligase n=1 Tax=Undibacterium amnicola TaxID=1834038 RepID=A0ABR6XP24_9BURK|nr:DNA ligase [Undibacterium amnicola]MBC3830647.1 DNA ligase [Undibacterium amnicola]
MNAYKKKLVKRVNSSQPVRRQLLLLSLIPWNLLTASASAKTHSAIEPNTNSPESDALKRTNLALVLPQTLLDVRQLGANISDYLMSEKLDGVRAYWDGKQLYFRSGRVINAPIWFIDKFPTHALDGELWMGRGQFERLSGAVRRSQANEDEWRQIRYCLFEYPLAQGDFDQRLQRLSGIVEKLQIPWLQVIPQEAVKSVEQVETKLKQLTLQKAEGLVLHLASAEFQSGRSDFVYKLKPQFDAEAKVIAIIGGQGRLQGMMGALLLETRDGKQFKLGTGFDDEQRKKPPVIGTWVTYRYRDLTSNGLPKFASFVREYQSE